MKEEESLQDTLLTESLPPQSHNNSAIGGNSCAQHILFNWLNPFLKYGSKHQITTSDMPSLPSSNTTQPLYSRIWAQWVNTPRRPTSGVTLALSATKTFKKEILIILIQMILVVSLNLLNPFLTSFNISYIQDKTNDISIGLLLFFATLMVQILSSIVYAQLIYKFSMLGVDLNNAFAMMIYGKASRFSCLASK